jgi:glycosyltransferase involved in cell wall biosynthesis
MTAFALAAYPLSAEFRARLDDAAGEPVDVSVLPELRRLGLSELVRRLRSLRGRCFLALEDPTSDVLLPILEALALVTRARSIEVVTADGVLHTSSRRAGVAHVGRLVGASADAQLALRRARRDLDQLLAADRSTAGLRGRNVLMLNPSLWFGVRAGGSIAHAAGVANAFAEAEYDVTVAAANDPVGMATTVSFHRLRPPRTYGLPVEGNLYRFDRSLPGQLAGVERPSFVYQRHAVGSYAGVVVSRRAGVPLVVEYNGSEVWVARHWGRPLRYEGLAVAAEDATLRHARLVVTVSKALADELAERGVDEQRIVWHPNGVDPTLFDPARYSESERLDLRRRLGVPADAVLATFVGTFGQWHGADVLARTIRTEVEWARASNVHFLFVGDGLTMPQVRAEVAGLEDIVTFAGLVPQRDTPLHLAASDVMVSPHAPNADGSPFFGSPTKLFEYMAAGRAIVASDLDQIGDILRDDVAVLVRPGDSADLGRGLKEAVADPVRRRGLGERARTRVLDRYTWRHHVDAILEALGVAER